MEIGSRSFPNVSASREADKVAFNPEIKEFFTPPSTGTVTGDVISPAASSVGLPDLPGLNATATSAAGTDTATVSAATFSFPPLTNDLNSSPPDTDYPSFGPFGDSVPSQADVEPPLEEEIQQVTVQEAFDDMVVLKDGMVTSASLSYERFQATDGHLQSQEAAASQEATASATEKTIPEEGVTQASAEESMDFLPEVPVGVGTDAPPPQEPAEGLDIESDTDVTKESNKEVPEVVSEAEVVSLTVESVEVQSLVEEQSCPEDGVTEQVSVPGVEAEVPETALKEPPAAGSELPSEKPPEEGFPSEKLPEGEPPSEKPPEDDPSSEKPPEIEVLPDVQPEGEPPIELSDGEETQKEPAVDGHEVSEQDIQAIKGQKVLKKFGKKDFVGDVVDYDPESKWFKVVYEDGDEEDLEFVEVKPLLVPPGTTPTSLTKKKRPRTDGDAEEELNKSSKKPKKMLAESSKSARKQKSKDGGKHVSKKQKGRSPGAKNVSKSPAKPKSKSPGAKLTTPKKFSARKNKEKAVKEPKSQVKPEEKVKSKIKSEEVFDSPPAKSPGKSSMKKGAAKSGTRTPSISKGGSSKSTKNAEVSGGSDVSSPKHKKTGKVKSLAKSPGKRKGKTGQNLKSPETGIKVEDTPKSSKLGTKRKIDVEEPLLVSSKRLRKGVTEKETVPGREIDRVGEATFIGKPVKKDFDGKLFDGVVVSYDKKRKYFKVKYEDGDQEDLEWRELELILVSEGKSDVDTEAKPAKVSLLSTLMSQEKKPGRSSAKKRKSTY